jgi:DNA-binding GntR family transcriptional regulator
MTTSNPEAPLEAPQAQGIMARDPTLNRTQGAYEALRADLLSCRILPGSRLKIQELCVRLAVSLGAIREALSRLTSEGLVVAEPQRGFRAAPISAADLQDLTNARIELETLCLRRAIRLGDVHWESKLVAATHRLSRTPERDPGDPERINDDWAEAHAAFHRALVEGCDSAWLMRLRGQLYDQSERYRRISVPLTRSTRNIEQEHQQIVTATLDRDAEAAASLLAAHLQATATILLSAAASDEMRMVEEVEG